MTKREALNGKPYAGNPHVRFDEGEAASTATSRRGSLLYKPYCESALFAVAAILFLDEGKRRVGELVNDVPDDVSPLTNDEYPHIQRERMFSQDVIATLDYALNKGFIPNAEHRMRILMEECGNLANVFGLRGMK